MSTTTWKSMKLYLPTESTEINLCTCLIMIFADLIKHSLFCRTQPGGKTQLTSAIFFLLLGMKAMTGPDLTSHICSTINLFLWIKTLKHTFVLQMRKRKYAEDRAKINRELNIFVLWKMKNVISGATDRTVQQGVAIAFITIKSRVNFDPWKWLMTVWHMEIHLMTNRCSLSW